MSLLIKSTPTTRYYHLSVVFCYVSRRAFGEDDWLQEIGDSSLVGDDMRVFVDRPSFQREIGSVVQRSSEDGDLCLGGEEPKEVGTAAILFADH